MSAVTLKGMTWNHPRGLHPLRSCSSAFTAVNPDVSIEWDARSLQDFADLPLEQLVTEYDLLVFDHPFIGEVEASKLLVPLDLVMPASFLQDQADNSVGWSHRSYQWGGHQWGLAIDAACHVSVACLDLLGEQEVPSSWTEVMADARRRAVRGLPRMAMPLRAIDAFLSWMTIYANDGAEFLDADGAILDVARAENALETLAELRSLAHPSSLEWNPIQMLDAMSTSDDVAYSPITFGYVNYATPGFRPRLLAYGTVPSGDSGIRGGVLGGAGLGVSARSAFVREAVDFAMFTASGEIQASTYVDAGGQPGHRAAWVDGSVDRHHGGFFSQTLPGIDASYVRPRWRGYLPAQTQASERVHSWLTSQRGGVSRAAGLVGEVSRVFSRAYEANGTNEEEGIA